MIRRWLALVCWLAAIAVAGSTAAQPAVAPSVEPPPSAERAAPPTAPTVPAAPPPHIAQDVQSTRDLGRVQVAFTGFIFVQPQRDEFNFDVLIQAVNLDTLTWIADGIELELPAGSKNVEADPASSLTARPTGGRRLSLSGTVPPGRHEARFHFQVPNSGRETASFDLRLPPRTAQFRVLVEARRDMHLSVAGFPPATRVTTHEGQPLLVAERFIDASGPPLSSLHVDVSGIPTRGSGPTLALIAALGFVVVGLGLAFRARRSGSGSIPRAQASRAFDAREILLSELVRVRHARLDGQLGTQAFTQTQDQLLDALARLELAYGSPDSNRAAAPSSLSGDKD